MRRTEQQIYAMAGNIAGFVRRRRKELGYTQPVLAERSGVGVRFIKELERGNTTLNLGKVSQVVAFLGGELSVKEKEDQP